MREKKKRQRASFTSSSSPERRWAPAQRVRTAALCCLWLGLKSVLVSSWRRQSLRSGLPQFSLLQKVPEQPPAAGPGGKIFYIFKSWERERMEEGEDKRERHCDAMYVSFSPVSVVMLQVWT